jgi:serine/threonine protein kinase
MSGKDPAWNLDRYDEAAGFRIKRIAASAIEKLWRAPASLAATPATGYDVEITPFALGSGTWGTVFKANDRQHLRRFVIKLEQVTCRKGEEITPERRQQLLGEYQDYSTLGLVYPPDGSCKSLNRTPEMLEFMRRYELDHLGLGIAYQLAHADEGDVVRAKHERPADVRIKPVPMCNAILLRAFDMNVDHLFTKSSFNPKNSPEDPVKATLQTIATFTRHVIWALAYIHESGHMHNDLKIWNICYNACTHQFFLVDFGLVSPIPTLAQRVYPVGAPRPVAVCSQYFFLPVRNYCHQLSTPASEVEVTAYMALQLLMGPVQVDAQWWWKQIVQKLSLRTNLGLDGREFVEELGCSFAGRRYTEDVRRRVYAELHSCMRGIVRDHLDERLQSLRTPLDALGKKCDWIFRIMSRSWRLTERPSTFNQLPNYKELVSLIPV